MARQTRPPGAACRRARADRPLADPARGIRLASLARDFLARAVGGSRKTSYRRIGDRGLRHAGDRFPGRLPGDRQACERARRDRRLAGASSRRLPLTLPFSAGARRRCPTSDRLLYRVRVAGRGQARARRRSPGWPGGSCSWWTIPRCEAAAVACARRRDGAPDRLLERPAPRRRSRAARRSASCRQLLPTSCPATRSPIVGDARRRPACSSAISDGRRQRLASASLEPAAVWARSSPAWRASASAERCGRCFSEEAALFVSPSATSPLITLVVNDVSRAEAGRLLERFQPLLAEADQAAGRRAGADVRAAPDRRPGRRDAARLALAGADLRDLRRARGDLDQPGRDPQR